MLVLAKDDWHREVWERWHCDDPQINFLIHAKRRGERFAPYETCEHVATKWGDVVPAQRILLSESLAKFPMALSFTFMSGECVPVLPSAEFKRRVAGSRSTFQFELVDWNNLIDDASVQPTHRFAAFGHTWVSFSRKHASVAAKLPETYETMRARTLSDKPFHHTHSLMPDEYAFHTHIVNELYSDQIETCANLYPPCKDASSRSQFYGELQNCVPIENRLITAFVHESGRHPTLIDASDLELMRLMHNARSEGHLFFRKVGVLSPQGGLDLAAKLEAQIWALCQTLPVRNQRPRSRARTNIGRNRTLTTLQPDLPGRPQCHNASGRCRDRRHPRSCSRHPCSPPSTYRSCSCSCTRPHPSPH